MSRMTDFTVPSTVPGRTLHAFCCEPEGEVRAVLQLSHGMVEFIDRYKPLAEYLAGQGIVVVGHDHLGHGGSIRTKADYGYFAEPDGNRAVLDDLHAMTLRTKERYPGVPYFLLGHSMGSFYARQYLCEYGQELSGAVIMGTGHQPKALVQFARSTCRALAVVHGWQYRSKLVANLSFMGYNKGLEGRTPTTGSTVTPPRWTSTWPTSAAPLPLRSTPTTACSAASCACTTRLFWPGCPRTCPCCSWPAPPTRWATGARACCAPSRA